MIRIEMDGICQGCKYADLELDYICASHGEKIWSIKCNHRDACDSMETKVINRMTKMEVNHEISD